MQVFDVICLEQIPLLAYWDGCITVVFFGAVVLWNAPCT